MAATIATEELTNITDDDENNGDGVFDKLMQTVEVHLQNQYTQGLISGSDYSQVYLGSLQAVLAQSVAYIKNEKDFVLTDSQVALTAAQEAEILASTIRNDASVAAQIALQNAQEALTDQKTITELAQTTDDDVAPYGTGSNPLLGILGSQQSLYKHQAQAFQAKHRVDSTKAILDSWAIAYSINEGAVIDLPFILGGSAATLVDLNAEVTLMADAMDVIS